jgi:hypothetical protein
VLGAVVVVFALPPPTPSASASSSSSSGERERERARELVAQVGRVVREGLGGVGVGGFLWGGGVLFGGFWEGVWCCCWGGVGMGAC